jgi:hypothetical protein
VVRWSAAAALAAVFAFFHLAFYRWSPVLVLYPPGVRLPEVPYSVLPRVGNFFRGYWGLFGWADYRAPEAVYLAIGALWLANAAVFVRGYRRAPERHRLLAFAVFAAVFTVAVLAGEYLTFQRFGPVVQGRYFLPVALGFAVVVCHPRAALRRAFVALLAASSLYGVQLTVDRYFADGWSGAFRALPFHRAPPSPAGPAGSSTAPGPAASRAP